MESKESPHSQDNPKQKDESWRHHAYEANQNSMALIPKHRYRAMEQNRGLGGNATHLQLSDL